MKPDNIDPRIKYYDIILENRHLESIPRYTLPEGYRFVYYKEGDKAEWIEIEKSAREFDTVEAGERAWEKYFEGHETDLCERMFFIETEEGEKVATASAYYDAKDREAGWLHWVAVKREYQGRGLAKPLISRALQRLVEIGYPYIKIPTQTTTWVAVNLYLDFGFVPERKNVRENRMGYCILKTLTHHPILEEFETLSQEDIWK